MLSCVGVVCARHREVGAREASVGVKYCTRDAHARARSSHSCTRRRTHVQVPTGTQVHTLSACRHSQHSMQPMANVHMLLVKGTHRHTPQGKPAIAFPGLQKHFLRKLSVLSLVGPSTHFVFQFLAWQTVGAGNGPGDPSEPVCKRYARLCWDTGCGAEAAPGLQAEAGLSLVQRGLQGGAGCGCLWRWFH